MCTIGPPRRPACRICLGEAGKLVTPCACRGGSASVHVECLLEWAKTNAKRRGRFESCELCDQPFRGEAGLVLARAWERARENYDDDLEALFRATDDDVAETIEAHLRLANLLASGDAEPRNFESALSFASKAAVLAVNKFGVESAQAAGAWSWRARLLTQQINGRDGYCCSARRRAVLAEPERLFRHALAIHDRVDPNSVIAAYTLTDLGNLLRQAEWFEEAVALHRRSLSIMTLNFGPNAEQVAVALANLGTCLFDANHQDEAVTLVRKALAIRERVFGSHHPDVAFLLMKMANYLAGQRAVRKQNKAEAIGCATRAVEIAGWTLGEFNETTEDYRDELFKLKYGCFAILPFAAFCLIALTTLSVTVRCVWAWLR